MSVWKVSTKIFCSFIHCLIPPWGILGSKGGYLFNFRDPNCDLRVQLPGVAMEHAKVIRSEDNSCEV